MTKTDKIILIYFPAFIYIGALIPIRYILSIAYSYCGILCAYPSLFTSYVSIYLGLLWPFLSLAAFALMILGLFKSIKSKDKYMIVISSITWSAMILSGGPI